MKKFISIAAIAFVLVAAAPPHANNGNVKIHGSSTTGDVSPITQNNPHVECPFHIHGFDFSSDTTWTISTWPPTGDKKVIYSGTGPISGPINLSYGHYRLDTVNPRKHKMFWADCNTVQPTVEPTVNPTVSPTNNPSFPPDYNSVTPKSNPTMPPTDINLASDRTPVSPSFWAVLFLLTLISTIFALRWRRS